MVEGGFKEGFRSCILAFFWHRKDSSFPTSRSATFNRFSSRVSLQHPFSTASFLFSILSL